MPWPDETFDFAMCIGVLHHIPNTEKAMLDCVKKIKPGGYFLVYLYYNFENRGFLFKALFKLSDMVRWVVCKFPSRIKKFVCDILAVLLYMPFVLFSRLLRFFGVSKKIRNKIPLHRYENTSYYIIRNDALDRFGTPLEQRFSKAEIEEMMKEGGLTDVIFGTAIPYWHAIGKKV